MRRGLIALGSLFGTYLIGTVFAAIAWESSSLGLSRQSMYWLLLVYLVFLAFAHVLFLVAVKLGLFHNMEEPKYFVLTIDEPDYYSQQEQGEEEDDATER